MPRGSAERYISDAARGFVDRALKRQIVARIDEEPQVRQHVAVFLAFVKRQPADDLIRHALLQERRFKRARQRVDPEKHRKLAEWPAGPLVIILDPFYRQFRFVESRVVSHNPNGLARRIFGVEGLRLALLVVGDDRVGGGEDEFCAAIIAIERDNPRVGKVALEIEDVANVGAAPFVNALIRIADDANVRVIDG
jgi:hypothetical protein